MSPTGQHLGMVEEREEEAVPPPPPPKAPSIASRVRTRSVVDRTPRNPEDTVEGIQAILAEFGLGPRPDAPVEAPRAPAPAEKEAIKRRTQAALMPWEQSTTPTKKVPRRHTEVIPSKAARAMSGRAATRAMSSVVEQLAPAPPAADTAAAASDAEVRLRHAEERLRIVEERLKQAEAHAARPTPPQIIRVPTADRGKGAAQLAREAGARAAQERKWAAQEKKMQQEARIKMARRSSFQLLSGDVQELEAAADAAEDAGEENEMDEAAEDRAAEGNEEEEDDDEGADVVPELPTGQFASNPSSFGSGLSVSEEGQELIDSLAEWIGMALQYDSSEVADEYELQCKKRGVRPNSGVRAAVRGPAAKDGKYSFSHCCMGDEGVVPVLFALAARRDIRLISFRDCKLTNKVAPLVAVFLRGFPPLEVMDLSQNRFSYTSGKTLLAGLHAENPKFPHAKLVLSETPLAYSKIGGSTVSAPCGHLTSRCTSGKYNVLQKNLTKAGAVLEYTPKPKRPSREVDAKKG